MAVVDLRSRFERCLGVTLPGLALDVKDEGEIIKNVVQASGFSS